MILKTIPIEIDEQEAIAMLNSLILKRDLVEKDFQNLTERIDNIQKQIEAEQKKFESEFKTTHP